MSAMNDEVAGDMVVQRHDGPRHATLMMTNFIVRFLQTAINHE